MIKKNDLHRPINWIDHVVESLCLSIIEICDTCIEKQVYDYNFNIIIIVLSRWTCSPINNFNDLTFGKGIRSGFRLKTYTRSGRTAQISRSSIKIPKNFESFLNYAKMHHSKLRPIWTVHCCTISRMKRGKVLVDDGMGTSIIHELLHFIHN